MSKKYFFMAGLPRSGNTLLSSILNQNPDINVSANSIVPGIFLNIHQLFDSEIFVNFPDQKSLDNVMSNVLDNYYANWTGKYIIDRSSWGTPGNLSYLKTYLQDEIKIICPVRNLLEIAESFKKFPFPLYPDESYKFLYTDEESFFYDRFFETFDSIGRGYWSVKNLCEKENRHYAHFIEYNDLVANPKKEIEKIYDFLEIPKYEHHYNHIDQFKVNNMCYNDKDYIEDLHTLKSVIQKSSTTTDNIPEKIKQKYAGLEIWRN